MSNSPVQQSAYIPGYCKLSPSEWEQRIQALFAHLQSCRLCPHNCQSHRLQGERGRCRVADQPLLAEACAHQGEEPVFGGQHGVGNLFFAGCQLRCVYCQNHQISQSLRGRSSRSQGHLSIQLSDAEKTQEQSWRTNPQEIATQMLRLQAQGVKHIGWVTPTPHLAWLLQALQLACQQGLQLPIIFNSGAYENPEILALLDGIVDIYLPDFKYVSAKISGRLSAAPDYVEQATLALLEMARQQKNKVENDLQAGLRCQGSLCLDAAGLAQQGLLVRHLVLPGYVSESIKVIDKLVETLGSHFSLSLMAQYQPMHHAVHMPGTLARPLRRNEYQRVLDHAEAMDLTHIIGQELTARDHYLPDFAQTGAVFK